MNSQVCQNMMDGKNREDVIRQQSNASNDDKIHRNVDVDQKKHQTNSQAQDITKMMTTMSRNGSSDKTENDTSIWTVNSSNNLHFDGENYERKYNFNVIYLINFAMLNL